MFRLRVAKPSSPLTAILKAVAEFAETALELGEHEGKYPLIL
jgi:hypothetical protein